MEKNEYVKLEANPNFYLSKVKTPNLIIKHIADPAVSSVELKNHKIDAALIDVSLLDIFKNDANFKILREHSADYRALMFNFDNKFLKELKIRQALNYAVDKNKIVKNLLHDYGFVATNPLQRSWANFNYKHYNYNPQKAEELLKSAGFSKNKDGYFQRNSEVLEFEIWAMSNDPLRVNLASILQSEFKKIGVLTKLKARLAGSFDYSKVDSFLLGWGSPLDPDFHTYRVFEGSQDTFLNDEGWNFGHYHDKKVDLALEKARSTLDLQMRKKYYAEFIKALYDNPPFIFLAYLDFALVYDSNIKGIKARTLGHHGIGFTWNVYEWVK